MFGWHRSWASREHVRAGCDRLFPSRPPPSRMLRGHPISSARRPSHPPARFPAASTAEHEQHRRPGTSPLWRATQGSLLPASASRPRASDRRHLPRTFYARSPLTHGGRSQRTAPLTGGFYSPAQGLANVVYKKTQPGKAGKVRVWVYGALTPEKAPFRCKADPHAFIKL